MVEGRRHTTFSGLLVCETRLREPPKRGISKLKLRFTGNDKPNFSLQHDIWITDDSHLYLSHAASLISDEQVQNILASSHRNNPSTGVTGVLVYMGDMFAQILEGPEQAVLRLYVKIIEDRRHSDCRILHVSPASERIFQKWSMGIIHSAPLKFQKIMDLKASRQEVVGGKVFTDAMIGFVHQLNAGALVFPPT